MRPKAFLVSCTVRILMKRFVTLLFCAIGMLYSWPGIAGALDSLKGPAEKLIVQQVRQTPPQLASAEESKYSSSTVASEAWTDWRDCSMLFDTLKELNCALEKMKQSGASQESMDFVRELAERKEGEGIGWLGEFREMGRVDLGSVEFPFRANTNTAFFLLNGSPSLISTELGCTVGGGWHQPCQRKGAVDISQDPNYSRLKSQYPNLELWPAGADFKSAQAKADGGQRFIFSYILVNGCHACYVGNRAEVAFDFDRNGKFTGIKLLKLVTGRLR
jgi:hypothetical protein